MTQKLIEKQRVPLRKGEPSIFAISGHWWRPKNRTGGQDEIGMREA
jgi:hypothetical protein